MQKSLGFIALLCIYTVINHPAYRLHNLLMFSYRDSCIENVQNMLSPFRCTIHLQDAKSDFYRYKNIANTYIYRCCPSLRVSCKISYRLLYSAIVARIRTHFVFFTSFCLILAHASFFISSQQLFRWFL